MTQWSNGDYTGATRFQDDLKVLTRNVHQVKFRPDDHGNDMSSATPLNARSALSGWGVIEKRTDVDFFEFTTGSGDVNIRVNAFGENPNLDVLATLYDTDGNVVAVRNPLGFVNASFNVTLDAGTYYLSVDGTGLDGEYSDYGSLGYYEISGSIIATNVGEAGNVSGLTEEWQTVQLKNNYLNPVVVAGPATQLNSDPTTVRVRSVTADSFEIQLDEWDYLDGTSTGEKVGYMVVEAGNWKLPDGTEISAGTVDGINHEWQNLNFGHTFGGTPIVVSQTMTRNGASAVTTRQRLITADSMRIKIQEEEAGGTHAGETVGWIAMDAAGGKTFNSNYSAFERTNVGADPKSAVFTQSFETPPVVLASLQDTIGGDPVSIRLKNVNAQRARLLVQEEQSSDPEITHPPEPVGVIAFDAGRIFGELNVATSAARVPETDDQTIGLTFVQLETTSFDDLIPADKLTTLAIGAPTDEIHNVPPEELADDLNL